MLMIGSEPYRLSRNKIHFNGFDNIKNSVKI